MNNTFYLKGLNFLIYAIFVIPLLFFSGLISPFVFPKVIIFRVIITIALLLYLLLVLKERKYLPNFNIVFIALSFFIVIYFITSFFGVDPYKSFWGDIQRAGGLFNFINYFVFFIVLSGLFKTKEDWVKIFRFSVFISLLIALYGAVAQKLGFALVDGSHISMHGTFGNSAFLAGYLLFHIFICLFLFFQKNISNKWKYFFVFAVLFESLIIVFTRVRGAIFALVVGLSLFFVFLLYSQKKKKMIIFFLVLVVILIGMFLKIGFLNTILQSETFHTRIWAWEIALGGWEDRPLLGWGPENFNIIFNKHFNPSFFITSGSENQWDRAHNIFLEILSTMGLIGFVGFIFVLFSVLYILIKRIKIDPEQKLTMGILITVFIVYLFHNLFTFDSFGTYIIFFALLAFVCSLLPKSGGVESKPKEASVFTIIILLVIFSGLIYGYNIQPALANIAASKAVFKSDDFNNSVDAFEKALDYGTYVRFDTRKRLANFILDISAKSPKLNNDLKKGFEFAIKEMEQSIIERPFDSQNYLYYSALCNRLARLGNDFYLEDNEQKLKKAIEFSPERQQLLFQLGELKLISKNYNEAIKLFQSAFELNPNSKEALWRLGLAEVEGDGINIGIEHMRNYIKKSSEENPYAKIHNEVLNLVAYLNREEEYVKIIALYELAVQNEHSNMAQTYASLATTYAAIGDFENAIENAEKAVETDSAFQKEAEVFIQSLLENK